MWKQFVSHKRNKHHGADWEMSDKEEAGGREGEAGSTKYRAGRKGLLAVTTEGVGARSMQEDGVAGIRIIFPFFCSI